MDLGDKIQSIIDNLEDSDNVKVFYTESTDGHEKTYEMVTTGDNRAYMNSYLKDYKEYGVVEDCDSKGVRFRFIDFELIKNNL
ncbi:hypothetical protein D3C84_675840 [compost metagenome]